MRISMALAAALLVPMATAPAFAMDKPPSNPGGGNGGNSGGGSDSPTPVPEPETMLILGSGLIGLIAARRLRKRG